MYKNTYYGTGDIMKKRKITELLIFIISAELTGALSALIAGDTSEFYSELVKPSLAPPGFLFPIVWTILYALMGISAFLIYETDAEESVKKNALLVYAIQLFVNFTWSIIFFRFEMPGLSSIVIVALFILVAVMISRFCKIRPAAAYINIPYLIWVGFASYLNIAIWLLNRAAV